MEIEIRIKTAMEITIEINIEIEIAIGPGLHLHQWVGNADQAQTHIVAISTGSYPGYHTYSYDNRKN